MIQFLQHQRFSIGLVFYIACVWLFHLVYKLSGMFSPDILQWISQSVSGTCQFCMEQATSWMQYIYIYWCQWRFFFFSSSFTVNSHFKDLCLSQTPTPTIRFHHREVAIGTTTDVQKRLAFGWLPNHFGKIEKMQMGVKLQLKGKTIFLANQRLKLQKDLCTPVLISALLFTAARTWKQPSVLQQMTG